MAEIENTNEAAPTPAQPTTGADVGQVETGKKFEAQNIETPPPAPPATDTGEIDSLRAQLAALQEKQATDLGAAEQLEKEREAWRAEVETDRARLRVELRNAALDRAGVIGRYHSFVPDLDVRTTEGQKALEKWIGNHPETVRAAETVAAPDVRQQLAAKSSRVAEILTGKRKSTLVNARSLAKMFDTH